MKARLLRLADRLRESYWFVPSVMAVGAMLLAPAMVYVDSHQGSTWMDDILWLYAARADGARSLLSSIGGSMIGVAGTTFSVTIAAVVYASGQYGPRLLSNFIVALSSRAFALFYALQCALALTVSVKRGVGTLPQRLGFAAIGLVCLVAVLVGAPAEG